MQGDMTTIARKAEQLEDYEDTIVRCIPNLLLMTMALFSELFMISKQSGDTNVSNDSSCYKHFHPILTFPYDSVMTENDLGQTEKPNHLEVCRINREHTIG
jgi:hypothetical protein